jgi:cytochrome P450
LIARRDSLDFLSSLTRQRGDVISYRSGAGPAVLIGHPDHARHVLVDNNGNYHKVTSLDRDFGSDFLGDGLLTGEGDVWAEHRRLMQPMLHRPHIDVLANVVAVAVDEMFDRWAGLAPGSPTLDVASEMVRLALHVAIRALFGHAPTVDVDAVVAVFARSRGIARPKRSADFAAFKFQTTRLIEEIVRARSSRADLLSVLLKGSAAQHDPQVAARQVHDEVSTLLFASATTTGHALGWTFYLLSEHPEAADRLTSELATLLGGRAPTAEDLPRLRFTRCVFEEALRLYPPGWIIGRRAIGDDIIGGRPVPAGTIVAVCPYLMHRHPDFWASPDQFDPDRFWPGQLNRRSRAAYLPFGDGPRRCVGNAFALMEGVLVVATVAQAYRLTLVPGHPVVAERSYVLYPRDGLLMIPRPTR